MRKFIKTYLLPPFIWNLIAEIKSFFYFLKFYKLISKNKNLKGIHKGKRCFILGSGPSIKKQNLKPLENEIVFALNNFYVHEDFFHIINNNSLPKYYMTAPIHPPQSEDEWRNWLSDMEKNIPNKVTMIFGINTNKININYLVKKYGLFINNIKFWYFEGKFFNFLKNNKLTGMNITKPIYSGETVSIYALIMAIYMGFDKIYLLGMDHDYFLYDDESNMRMYKTSIHQKDEIKRTFGNSFYIEEFLRQYKIFKKYDAFNTYSKSDIFNASAGGILKVFRKVKFEDLF
mgnify:FL=1